MSTRLTALVQGCVALAMWLGAGTALAGNDAASEPPLSDRGAWEWWPDTLGGLAAPPGFAGRVTLLPAAQRCAERILLGRQGSAVIVDVETAGIVAMANAPVAAFLRMTTNSVLSFLDVATVGEPPLRANRCVVSAHDLGRLAPFIEGLALAGTGDAGAAQGRERVETVAAALGFGRASGLPFNAQTNGFFSSGPPATGAATALQVARLALILARRGEDPDPRVLVELPEAPREGPVPAAKAPWWNDRTDAFAAQRLEREDAAGRPVALLWTGGEQDAQNSWMLGYVPADRPAYAFAVVLERANAWMPAVRREVLASVAALAEARRWAWKEPAWSGVAGPAVRLRWKWREGARYAWRLAFSGRPRRARAAWRNELVKGRATVGRVGDDGCASLTLRVRPPPDTLLGAEPPRTALNAFVLGGYTAPFTVRVTPLGGVTWPSPVPLPEGLAALPRSELGIGTQWSVPVRWRPVWHADGAEAAGTAVCQLTGVARGDGARWVRVAFGANVRMDEVRTGVRKVIGVSLGSTPALGGRGVGVGSVLADYPAQAAGLRAGDVITEVASIRVRSWSDLVSALALQPFDEPVAIGWRRGEAAREAVMVPRTTVYGEISGRGRLEGSFVFDVDHGRLVRMDLDVCRFSWQERRENRTHREAWQGTASLQIMTGDTEEADGERE